MIHWIFVLFNFSSLSLTLASDTEDKRIRYLLYDVNYGEGFNLRRDVYVRFANLVRFLNSRQSNTQWTLVLPPWGRLYHWFNNRDLDRLPWSTFFDVPSLGLFVPVVEFQQFLADTGGSPIDKVYYLQSLPFDGKWSERVEPQPCKASHSYHYSRSRDLWFGWMYGYTEQPIREFACLGVQAEAKTLVEFVLSQAQVGSVMFDRGEAVIHGSYSEWSPEWWTARRSMVFSSRLRQLAADFRREQLNSSDEADRTVRPQDWRSLRVAEGSALGGPYLAVHLRRRDFASAHPDAVPPLAAAAAGLARLAESLGGLAAIFLATDDPAAEAQLAAALALLHRSGSGQTPRRPIISLFRYRAPSASNGAPPLTDGELAAIDQIVCSHARHFVGTRASTFTYRVVEERSLIGFAAGTSVGVMCADGGVSGAGGGDCQSGTHWPPRYEAGFTIGSGAQSVRQEL